jgi:7-cyano-7-deazaguanine synthase in queuosine biosynthesis
MPSTNYRQHKVGKNFETAIANAPITRTELADLLGIHSTSLTYWYKRGVTADYANQVAELLDLDVKTIQSRQIRSPRKHTKTVDNIIKVVNGQPMFRNPEPRTVNIELLAMVANMRLSAQQETTLHSLALTFLGEES